MLYCNQRSRCADLLNHYFLFYNKVYNLLRNIDLFHDISSDLSFYRSFTCSNRILFCDISRNHDDRLYLTVYLYGNLDLIVLHGFLIALRPGRVEYAVCTAKLPPELLAKVWSKRSQ